VVLVDEQLVFGYPVAVNTAGQSTFTAPESGSANLGTFQGQPGTPIQGTIVDFNGIPISHSWSATGPPPSGPAISTYYSGDFRGSASDGSFSFLTPPDTETGLYISIEQDGVFDSPARNTDGESVFTPSITEPLNAGTFAARNNFSIAVSLSGDGQGTVTSDPAGIDCGSTCIADFTPGTMATFIAAADLGSVFSGWGGACSGSTPVCVVPVNTSQVVTAEFTTVGTATLTVDISGEGSGTVSSQPGTISCPGTCSDTFTIGTEVTLTATPAENNAFNNWIGTSCGSELVCYLELTGDLSIGAVFNSACSVTATAGVGGSVSPAGTTTLPCGTDQTIIITPDDNYAIVSLTVDGQEISIVSLYVFESVSGDHTLHAEFGIYGCLDPNAVNYNPNATHDSNTCQYEQPITTNSDSDTSFGSSDGSLQLNVPAGTGLYLNGIQQPEVVIGLNTINPWDRLTAAEMIENIPTGFDIGANNIWAFTPYDLIFTQAVFISIPYVNSDPAGELIVLALDNDDDETWSALPNATCAAGSCSATVLSLGLFVVVEIVADPEPYTDDCGVTDSDPSNDNSTCSQDCAGVWDGLALIDMCGICDADPLNDCTEDCNGDWGGVAYLDECLVCVGGSTGLEPNLDQDCAGVCFGDAYEDLCQVCDDDPANDGDSCSGCIDPEAMNYDQDMIIDDGSCLYQGDFDGDGVITVNDILDIVQLYLYNIPPTENQLLTCDLYPDGVINIIDLVAVVYLLLDLDAARLVAVSSARVVCDTHTIQIHTEGDPAAVELWTRGQYLIPENCVPDGWQLFQTDGHLLLLNLGGTVVHGPLNLDFDGELELLAADITDWQSQRITAWIDVLPGAFALEPARPNPFNPVTTLRFHTPDRAHVRLAIYNLLGAEVAVLHDAVLAPGIHTLSWNATDLPAGIYIAVLSDGQSTLKQKLLLLK